MCKIIEFNSNKDIIFNSDVTTIEFLIYLKASICYTLGLIWKIVK